MNKTDQQANIYIESHLVKAIALPDEGLKKLIVENKHINIANKKFILNCWIEEIKTVGNILIVQVERKAIYGSKVFSGAMLVNEKRTVLSQSELWNLGVE